MSHYSLAMADVNECDNIENVTCSEDAECINTEGNYSCQCKSGFTGDGYNCTGKNFCYMHCVILVKMLNYCCRYQ